MNVKQIKMKIRMYSALEMPANPTRKKGSSPIEQNGIKMIENKREYNDNVFYFIWKCQRLRNNNKKNWRSSGWSWPLRLCCMRNIIFIFLRAQNKSKYAAHTHTRGRPDCTVEWNGINVRPGNKWSWIVFRLNRWHRHSNKQMQTQKQTLYWHRIYRTRKRINCETKMFFRFQPSDQSAFGILKKKKKTTNYATA